MSRRPVVIAATLFLFQCASTQKNTSLLDSGPTWLARPSSNEALLSGYRVIFVAGFLNEIIPNYFDDNVRIARALGASTAVVFPRSSDSLTRSVERILTALHSDPRPAVLVGHSKGGAAVVLAALRNPHLMLTGRVHSVISIQGSLGRSSLADALVQIRPLRSAGLNDLTTEKSQEMFSNELAQLAVRQSEDEQNAIFSRIFYVRSKHQDSRLGKVLAPSELLLRMKNQNDGLLMPDDMRLNRGVDLGVLDADHASLTVSSVVSVSTPAERQRFSRALFEEVFLKSDPLKQ
jgi:pimeloyl-ACP methyl ester carboxylesterase